MIALDDAFRRGFLFDLERCTGCHACELACSTENGLGWGTSWRQVVSFNEGHRPGVPGFHLSLACNHCDDAPCVRHCPTLALGRDRDTGAVLIDSGRCIGCRYCSWVCPYDAPRFDQARGIMTKCTLCRHRLLDGRSPACVEACPTAALGFGPLEGTRSVPGFPETPVGPRIRFRRRTDAPRVVESTWKIPADVVARDASAQSPDRGPDDGRAPARSAAPGISLRSELPLWLFTSVAAGLVGWVLAAALGGPAPRALPFAGLALAAIGVSTLHLGREHRAWQALSNLRGSWLSREIASFGAFLAAAGAALAWPHTSGVLPWAASALGMVALFAVDRVYDPVRAPRLPLHSADTVVTGPLVAAALLRRPTAFAVLGGLKLLLYVGRRMAAGTCSRILPLPRLGVGLAVPLLLWAVAPQAWGGWPVLALLTGELLDRAEFYGELRIRTPGDEMRRAEAAWPGR